MATELLDQAPPHNLDAERSVLGAMLVAGDAMISKVVLEVGLTPEDFYRERHRLIYRAVRGLYEESKPMEPLTVAEALRETGELEEAGGEGELLELAAAVPLAGNAKFYAEIVRENSLLRRLLNASHAIRQKVGERDGDARHLVEEAEKLLFEVAHEHRANDFRRVSELLSEEMDKLERLLGDEERPGTPSGFRHLDKLTGGFQPGNLVVVAARPSVGKSAFVINIAEYIAAERGRPVAFFSLEMSEAEIAQRLIATRARIPADKLRTGEGIRPEDLKDITKVCNQLEAAPFFIDDSPDLTLLELRSKARRLHSQTANQGGLGAVIVDYLQLMRSDERNASRVEIVATFSRGLKALAREIQVPVIALSQLSRAPELRPGKEKIPMLSDLRESGQIEQDADLVAFLYRPHIYTKDPEDDGFAEVIVAKHRNGPTGTVHLFFSGEQVRFRTLTEDDYRARVELIERRRHGGRDDDEDRSPFGDSK